jgi:hypothetical protein
MTVTAKEENNMKYLLILMFTSNVFANGQYCDRTVSPNSDCEVVKTLTRCDVDKQKLRNKIYALEKRIKELESRPREVVEYPYPVEKIVEKTIVKKVIKKHIVSVITSRDVEKINAYQTSSTTATAQVETGYVPAVTYQYQFDMGLTPLIGASFGSKVRPVLGLGFEF